MTDSRTEAENIQGDHGAFFQFQKERKCSKNKKMDKGISKD